MKKIPKFGKKTVVLSEIPLIFDSEFIGNIICWSTGTFFTNETNGDNLIIHPWGEPTEYSFIVPKKHQVFTKVIFSSFKFQIERRESLMSDMRRRSGKSDNITSFTYDITIIES